MFELYSLYNTSGAKCVPSDHFICFACVCVQACKCACTLASVRVCSFVKTESNSD